MNNIAEVSEMSFAQEVLNEKLPVVVDVYAPWCGPCKMLAPMLEKLAEEFAGKAKFIKLNVDEAAELASRYGITGVPTLLFFQNGEVRDSVVGLGSPAMIRSRINEAINQASGVV